MYPRISAQDMLSHLALLKGITNSRERKEVVSAMLQRCDLYDVRKKALTGFSGGMRQRFGIAQALLGNPQLFDALDEPTAGLDPGERNRFYNLLAEVGEQVIVILSTHIVEDVMDLCTNMAIIHAGKVLYQGEPQSAISKLNGRIWQRSIEKTEAGPLRADFPRCLQQTGGWPSLPACLWRTAAGRWICSQPGRPGRRVLLPNPELGLGALMFLRIASFEIRFWLRSWMVWIFLFIIALLIFGAVSTDQIQVGNSLSNTYHNAPYVIQNYYSFIGLLTLLMSTAFVTSAAIRQTSAITPTKSFLQRPSNALIF